MDSGAIQRIKERIRKLIALSQSPHPEEASSARAKAEDLLARYGLMEDGEFLVEDAEEGERVLLSGLHISEWRIALAALAAMHAQCRALLYSSGYNPGLRLTGRKAGVRKAIRLFTYLDTKIMEISPKYIPVVRDIEGFRLGMVAGIHEGFETEADKTGPEDRHVTLTAAGSESGEREAAAAGIRPSKGSADRS